MCVYSVSFGRERTHNQNVVVNEIQLNFKRDRSLMYNFTQTRNYTFPSNWTE